MEISTLQKIRYAYKPKLPASLAGDINGIAVQTGSPTGSVADQEALKALFKETYGKPPVIFGQGNNDGIKRKLTVGVILSGGQAPGGHNVIAGLYDGLKKGNRESRLIGILGGPGGLINNKSV